MEGVQKAIEELSNSQKLHMINPKWFYFSFKCKGIFKVFFNFYADFLKELGNTVFNGVTVTHAKTRIIEPPPCDCNLDFLAVFLQLMHW